MGWIGLGLGCEGQGWVAFGLGWDGLGWDGMGWDGMNYVGLSCIYNLHINTIRYLHEGDMEISDFSMMALHKLYNFHMCILRYDICVKRYCRDLRSPQYCKIQDVLLAMYCGAYLCEEIL